MDEKSASVPRKCVLEWNAAFCLPGVSGWRRVFLGRQQEPPRAPAGGREETRSPPILPAPSPATDKKRIYRLFSALPGKNRSQREVFLVQPRLRWRKLRHLAAPSVEKPILSFFPNLALLSQNVQSGWFFHFETGFSVKWWIFLPQDERMGSIFHSTAGKPKCFPTEARETPARSFFTHKMKKCAGDSFCAFGHWDRGYFPAEQRITSKSS